MKLTVMMMITTMTLLLGFGGNGFAVDGIAADKLAGKTNTQMEELVSSVDSVQTKTSEVRLSFMRFGGKPSVGYVGFAKTADGEFGLLIGVSYQSFTRHRRNRTRQVFLPLDSARVNLVKKGESLFLLEDSKEVTQVGESRWWWYPKWQLVDSVDVDVDFERQSSKVYKVKAVLHW